MKDETNVRLVDPQAEGIGRYQGLEFVGHEAVLSLRAATGREPAVVAIHLQPRGLQECGQLLDGLDRGGVDNAGPVGFLELLQQQRPLFRFAPGMDDVQLQVGAVEAGVDDLGIGHAQLGEDVLDDVGSGRGRQGHDRRPSQVVDGLAQSQIVGAKVVAPLTDAVSLIDDEQLDFPGLEQFAEPGIGEALGRGVDNGGPAQGDVLLGGDLLAGSERAIHAHRPDAVVEEVIDLVFHQRDERADDDGDRLPGRERSAGSRGSCRSRSA